jgi:hypothetical protein
MTLSSSPILNTSGALRLLPHLPPDLLNQIADVPEKRRDAGEESEENGNLPVSHGQHGTAWGTRWANGLRPRLLLFLLPAILWTRTRVLRGLIALAVSAGIAGEIPKLNMFYQALATLLRLFPGASILNAR